MQGVYRLVALSAAGWLLAGMPACHDRGSRDQAVSAVEATSPVEHGDSSADKIAAAAAVQLIKAQALEAGLHAMVRQPYTVTRAERTACGEAELVYDRNTYPQGSDLRLCQPTNGGAPYYKYTAKEETRCCRTVQVKVPADVRWKAAGRDSDGNWLITGSFRVGGLQHQTMWMVDAQTQEVCELPPVDDTLSRSSRGYCSSHHQNATTLSDGIGLKLTVPTASLLETTEAAIARLAFDGYREGTGKARMALFQAGPPNARFTMSHSGETGFEI